MPWGPFLTYALITTYTPGPNNITSMVHGSRLGFKRSYPFNIGIYIGFTLVMIVSALFSQWVLSSLPQLMFIMQALGTAYILYLAYSTFKSKDIKWSETEGRGGATVKAGFLLQLVNAKIYIYGISSMSLFILPYVQEEWKILLFAVLLSSIGMTANVTWAIVGDLLRKTFNRHYKIINIILSLLLIYAAISLWR